MPFKMGACKGCKARREAIKTFVAATKISVTKALANKPKGKTDAKK